MKKHSLYRWFRHLAMLSGITVVAMMFACTKKYGPPDDMKWSQVLDKDIQEMSNDVSSLP